MRSGGRWAIAMCLGAIASPAWADTPETLIDEASVVSFRLRPLLSEDVSLAVQETIGQQSGTGPAMAEPAGPSVETVSPAWTDHVPSERATRRGFWSKVGTVKTEALIAVGYFSVISATKFTRDTTAFHFKDEGWFEKDTRNVGVDKLAHAFGTYLLTEYLHDKIHRRSEASQGDALTAAALASSLVLIGEFADGFEPDSGWSMNDVAMNIAGAGFSVLRNTVPGFREKLAFKIEVVPNDQIYSFEGRPHFEQQRYMISLKGAGFEELHSTPLRYLDLQAGYYASNFQKEDREAGIVPTRHFFVGIGLNVGELLFGGSQRGFGRTARTVLDYFQVPRTSLRYDSTGHFGF